LSRRGRCSGTRAARPEDQRQFAAWAHGAVESLLPPHALAALRAFDSGEGPPAILLRGLGVEPDLEGTDAAREPGFQKNGQRSEAWTLGVASLLGGPQAVSQEVQGAAAAAAAAGEALDPDEPSISIGHLVARPGSRKATRKRGPRRHPHRRPRRPQPAPRRHVR
jgi:hypothetical protein